MRQTMATLEMRRYCLQPGDGTRYEFYIVPLDGAEGVEGVIGGVGDGEGFVTLGVCMKGSQGSYEVRIRSLRDPHFPFLEYVSGQMNGVYIYTLAAVILAASVLVDRPAALQEAAEAMLRAPEFVHDL